MKFLSQINVNTEYTLPIVDGTNGQVLATDGNGTAYWGSISAGATNLNALTDVVISSPSTGQLLRYGIPLGSEDPNPVWYNWSHNFLTTGSSIDALGDVTISSATTGQILQWSGSAWVNATLTTAGYVSKVQHEVKAGVAITKGQAVYVTGADGTNMIVGLASNTSEGTSSKTMGIALSTAAVNGKFFAVTEGLIDGINTSTANAGDPVWLGTNGNLIFGLLNKPTSPAHLVYLGVVTRANQNNGEIFVKVQNGVEIDEIHDVQISSPSTGQLLRRDTDGYWKNWTPNYLTAHPSIVTGGSVNNSNGTVVQDITLETNGHVTSITSVDLDTRYYTESEITAFFGGELEIAGYNQTNWDAAYSDKINSASFSTTTGVLTLTQQDLGTVTVDLDGRYLESLPSHTHAASDITSGTLSTDRLPKQELGISIVGNFGQWQLHSAYTNFNTAVNYWGWNYVQGNTNAPHQTSSQWYRGRFSLGNEYGFGNDSGDYWMEIAIPRYNLGDNAGNLFVRTAENGTIGGWQGVRAAYATNANYATSAGDSTNLGGLSSARYAKQDYYNEGYNWDTIGAASADAAIVLRVESSATNPPANDVYNWSLWQQGTKLRGSQIAVSAYGEPRMFFRGADGDTNAYAAWNEIIHSGNIASQTIGYASQAVQVIGQSGQNYASDNRTISPSEISPGYLQFGFTSWTNNNASPWADYLHMRSYTDGSGGADNLVMFKKTGIGMRIWQQTFGSSTAYSSYADVWTTGDFTSTNVTNWNTAYGWGNHSGLYLPLSGGTLSGNLNTNSAIAFRDGAGGYSNIIRAAGYPSEGYSSSDKYWMEYRAYGGHHFVLNVDGGVGGGQNTMDDFVIWQGAIDGDRLLELTNGGSLTISGTFTEQSSIRYKENVKSIPNVSQKVEQLDAVSYNKIGSNQEEIGLIAEDVAELFPEVVKYDNEGRPDGVNYSRLSVILLKAMQEQNAVIAALTERVNKLENK